MLLFNKDIIKEAIEGGKEGWEKGWKKGYELGYNFTNTYKDQTPSMPQYNLGGYY